MRENFLTWIQSFKPIFSIIAIVAALLLWKLLCKFFANQEKTSSKSRQTVISVIRSIVKYMLLILTVLLVLQLNDVNVGSLLAGLGIISVIVGLALQDAIKDMIMGVHILSDGFFAVGDVIKIDGIEGIVRSFTLRTTKIEVLANQNIYVICNRDIEKVSVTSRQVDIDIPLSYDDDVDRIRSLLTSFAEEVRRIEGVDDCMFKGTENFDASSIAYKLRFWCSPTVKGEIRRKILGMLQDVLKKEGISIPYDQLDVHMDR